MPNRHFLRHVYATEKYRERIEEKRTVKRKIELHQVQTNMGLYKRERAIKNNQSKSDQQRRAFAVSYTNVLVLTMIDIWTKKTYTPVLFLSSSPSQSFTYARKVISITAVAFFNCFETRKFYVMRRIIAYFRIYATRNMVQTKSSKR